MADPYAKTRVYLRTLFEQVNEGKFTPEEAADIVVRSLAAGARARQQVDDVLFRHIEGLVRR